MEVLKVTLRPEGRIALNGAMREVPLLHMEGLWGDVGSVFRADKSASGIPTQNDSRLRWQMGLATVKAGSSVPPVPFPTDELGFVLAGRVELTELAKNYDTSLPLEEQATVVVLTEGDAFRLGRGDRVMMEVLEDLSFLYLRAPMPAAEAGCSGRPGAA